MIRFFKHKTIPFLSNKKGSITVETALISTMLIVLTMGVLNFGLIYVRSMELSNAVRAGAQYATVRKPVSGDLTDIEDAVAEAISDDSSSISQTISVSLYCACADGTSSDCLSTGGSSLACTDGSDRQAFVTISVTETYEYLFAVDFLADNVTLTRSTEVRLN